MDARQQVHDSTAKHGMQDKEMTRPEDISNRKSTAMNLEDVSIPKEGTPLQSIQTQLKSMGTLLENLPEEARKEGAQIQNIRTQLQGIRAQVDGPPTPRQPPRGYKLWTSKATLYNEETKPIASRTRPAAYDTITRYYTHPPNQG
jgi:hypothetical protein